MLRAHEDGPQRFGELQEAVGWAPEATLRGAVSNLRDLGALEKRPADHAINAVITALTPVGKQMLQVPVALEAWLQHCPKGPISIYDGQVTVAVKALAEGWSTALMRALATSPHTLTELSDLIHEVSYPALERRINWMRATGQISSLPKEGRGTPYVPTDWLRRSIAPLAVAGRCERQALDDAPPITDVEVETSFLLTLPLVALPRIARGSCILASHIESDDADDGELRLAGVAVEVSSGEIVSTTVSLEAEPSTWAIGTNDAWLDAVIDGRFEGLRLGGVNPHLALAIVRGIHDSMLPNRRTRPPDP